MLADLVYEITATSGTGPFTLGGARSVEFRTFAAAHSIGDTVYYCCRAGGQWEVGLGTLTSATTLARTTIYNGSSGAGVAVNFAAGNKELYETLNSGSQLDLSSLSASGTFADDDKVLVLKADGSLQTILGSIIKAAGTATPPADTTAPTLSSPAGSSTGTTTASGTVSTNEANGTLYWLVSTGSTATAAAVKAGSSQAVSATGSQSVTASGLTASTSYYIHYLHRDAAGNDSTVVSSAQFTTSAAGDTTAPTLSSPTGTKTGQATASGTVSTNEANGTLYFLASTSATATAAAVKAAGSQAVSASGAQSVTFTGLTAATTYYAHYLHRDAAGNDSTVSSSASFTTDAAAATSASTYNIRNAQTNGSTTSVIYPEPGNISTNGFFNGSVNMYVRSAANAVPLLTELTAWTWSKRDGSGNPVRPTLANQTSNGQKQDVTKIGGWADGETAHAYYGLFSHPGTLYIWGTAGTYDLWLFYADGSAEPYDNGTGTPPGLVLT